MAEERRLESLLDELAPELEWPSTPDLTTSVGRRIRRRGRPGLAVLLLAAALAGALALGTAVTVYLGLRGATISRVQSLPSPSASQGVPPADGVGARLQLGRLYPSVAEAQSAAGFGVLVPSSLGQPDQVYYRPDTGLVTLLYRPRPDLPAAGDPEVGALVMEIKASVDEGSFGKVVGNGTTVERVKVNGGPGFWISGARHGFFFYSGRSGKGDQFRLAGDVLIWNQGDLTIRIESSLDRRRAQAAAASVR
jgi:hypothetical protein